MIQATDIHFSLVLPFDRASPTIWHRSLVRFLLFREGESFLLSGMVRPQACLTASAYADFHVLIMCHMSGLYACTLATMLLGKDYWPGKCGDSDKPSGVKV